VTSDNTSDEEICASSYFIMRCVEPERPRVNKPFDVLRLVGVLV